MLILKKISGCLVLVIFLFTSCNNETNEQLDPNPNPIEQISPPQSGSENFPRLLYTQEQINYVASRVNERASTWYPAYTRLISIADSYADRKHAALEDFHTPSYYGNTGENILAKEGLAQDSHAAHANALAFALTGKKEYGYKAIYFLNAWASINKTVTEIDSQGETTGTILTFSNLSSNFLAAADLLFGHLIWSEEDKSAFKKWTQHVVLPNVSSIKGRLNNWGDWGTFATVASYHILGNKAELLNEVERIKTRIDMHQNIDGSMPQETRRESNGLWYTYFALTPITLSAQLVFNTTGVDLFSWESPNGKSIQKALDYLEYYELHKSEWPWYSMKDSAPTKDAPSDLFEMMNDFYNKKYNDFVKSFRPITGGYKGSRVSHMGWSFPTLMKMEKRTPSKYPNL